MDAMYDTGEARAHAALPDLSLDLPELLQQAIPGKSLRDLAAWAGTAVRDASVPA